MQAVYFFCNDLDKDPVAKNVYNEIEKNYELVESNIDFDSFKVMNYIDKNNNVFSLVRTKEVLSHNYGNYVALICDLFGNYDVAGVVNWHEGANSIDKVLTVHTIGDVPSGVFGKTNPNYFKNLLHSIESKRVEYNLDSFMTYTEATHWSGTMYNLDPNLLSRFNVPTYDIEIGSTKDSFNNEMAIKCLAHSLFEVFNNKSDNKVLLCVGGVHFEESFRNCIFNSDVIMSIGHILPNQWLVSGKYELDDGIVKLENSINSISENIDAIVIHDGLKGIYKQKCRELGEKLNIPVIKHKTLKDLEKLKEIFKK